MVGDAQFVIEKIAQSREAINLDHLVLMQQFIDVPYEKILASLNRLIEYVVPVFGTQQAS
jgi:hypothetical protein